MFKKVFVAIIAVVLLVGAIVYAKMGQFVAMGEAAENMVFPPETVTTMTVESTDWEQVIKAPASVSPVQGVTVSAEVGGRISEITFMSGASVEQGDVLIQLDATTEAAQLAAAEATAALAKADLARVRKLGQRDLASDDTVDRAAALVKETVAQVGVIEAQIAKKSVRAPFAGQLGLRLVNLGQIIGNDEPIVTLQTLDPVHLDFSLPQQQLPRIEPGMDVRVQADTAPGEMFPGEIIAINPEVDRATRNVRVRALVANLDLALRSGMFVNVEVVLPERKAVLPVAATAVLYAPFGDSVFVVEDRETTDGESQLALRQQFVQLGEARGDFIDVTDGLEPGEVVVTSGVFKLSSDMNVVIDNTLAPKPELAPSPADS
jgi:membrane fusion protein (multidrug efflux system)